MERLKSISLRRIATYCGAILVTVYGALQVRLWLLRSESLEHAASSIVRAFVLHDADSLWYYSFEGEKEAYGLDRKKFDGLFRDYVFPQAHDLRLGESQPQAAAHGSQLQFVQPMYQGENELSLSFVVFRTREGPKAFLVREGVSFAMQSKYGATVEAKGVANRYHRSIAKGVETDRASLESHGLRGFAGLPPGSPLVSWERLAAFYETAYGSKGASPHSK